MMGVKKDKNEEKVEFHWPDPLQVSSTSKNLSLCSFKKSEHKTRVYV